MNLEQDFEDFVALLNKHDVHYGVDFKDAYDHKYTIDIDGLIINYIGLWWPYQKQNGQQA